MEKRYLTNFGVPLYASHMEKGSDGTILVGAVTIELGFFSILKFSTEGEIIWSKGYAIEPSRENEYVERCAVKETADGEYMFFILTDFALYIIRISSEGEVLWAKSFSTNYGFFSDEAGDENFILYIQLQDYIPLYVNIDTTNGNVVWAKTFFINGEMAHLFLKKVEENGNMVFTAWGGGLSAYIKFSPSFVPIIQRYYELEPRNWWLNCTTIKKYDEEGDLLWRKCIEPLSLWDAKESPEGHIVAVGAFETSDWWPPDIAGLILRADSNMRIGGACSTYEFYYNEVSGNVSYKDFEISYEELDKSRIRISTSYGIFVRHPSDDSEYLCYTGCVKVAVCTDDFPPQCTVEKECDE